MLSFIKSKHNCVAAFDLVGPEIDLTQFPTEDWSATTCGPYREDSPSNLSTPRGVGLTIRAFADYYHARDSITRRSITSFVVLLNSTHIFSFYKK